MKKKKELNKIFGHFSIETMTRTTTETIIAERSIVDNPNTLGTSV